MTFAGFTLIFVLEQKFAYAWGDTSSIFWGAGPEIPPLAPSLLLYFGTQSSLGWHNSNLGGTNSDLVGHGPEMPPWRLAHT